ncbi:MAG: hypothetical protein ABR577_13010 [Pyrinomonadaceae bacterium]
MTYEETVKFLKSLLAGDLLGIIASYASIVSLVLTIYVALSVGRIKNSYIFRVRAPKFERALRKHTAALTNYGNDFTNSIQEIGDELERADVKLRAMQGRMRGESRQAVKQLRKLIKAYEQAPDDEPKFRVVYRKMQRVIEEVKEYQEDLDLE